MEDVWAKEAAKECSAKNVDVVEQRGSARYDGMLRKARKSQ